jgi:hypothetical protein
MKSIFETLAYVWLTFTLIMLPILWLAYDGKGDNLESYFRLGTSLYYVGYLGEVE